MKILFVFFSLSSLIGVPVLAAILFDWRAVVLTVAGNLIASFCLAVSDRLK